MSGKEAVEGPIYDAGKLGAGATLVGRAIIEQETTTITIEFDWRAELHESRSYVLTSSS